MKIAAIQLNPVIGDFTANSSAMLNWAKKAKEEGADLAIFPEMAISGYPPQDLLERPAFIAAHQLAMQSLQEQCGLPILFGSITPCSSPTGKPLHNSAILSTPAFCHAVHKQLLPTYDVFDESRYFEPGGATTPVQFQGKILGITICEDIFNDPTLFDLLTEGFDDAEPSKLYAHNPVQNLVDASETGLDILINIAASPFHLRKPEVKLAFFRQLAKKHNTPIIYVNQVGGQDSLVFDGQSLVIDGSGNVLARAPRF
nr:NAD+ synthase [Desulfobulbaceae bacterium]